MTLSMFSWLLVLAALYGAWLNVKQDRRCFYIWSVTNIGLAGCNVISGQWPDALLFFVYFLLAVYGLYFWQRQQRAKSR